MLKGEDIVLLLKLSDSPPDWTVRTLAEETSIPRSVVHRALKRLAAAYQRPGPPSRWPDGSRRRRANCRPYGPTPAARAVALPCARCTRRSPRRLAETRS